MELLPTSALQRSGIGPDTRVLLALSGGADSTALLLLLSDAKREGRIGDLTAAHFHHGLRKGADEDAVFCETLCKRLDVPFYIARTDVHAEAEASGESIEAAARRLRYAFLRELKYETKSDCIVTAHHADDQAETVLLHLLRGSGLKGICGMQMRNGDVARPLLSVTHAQLLTFLSECGQSYRTDETNADLRYTRNRIRHELLPQLESYNPRICETLCGMAELLSEDERFLSQRAESLLLGAKSAEGYDRTILMRADRPIRMRALLQLLTRCCGDDYCRTDAEKLNALLTAQAGASIELRDGFSAWNDGSIVRIGRRKPQSDYCRSIIPNEEISVDGWKIRCERAASYTMPKDGMEACMSLDTFPGGIGALYVRPKRDGDRFRPLGSKGTKLVSDVYADRKYCERLRQAPLLFCGEELLFVPGYTIAEAARVTEKSKTIIQFKIEEDEGV